MADDWTVYLLKCSDGTLYCGVTNDLDKRVAAHNAGRGAKYTRGRGPITVVAFRAGLTKSAAMKLEYAVKQQPRANKVDYLERNT